MDDLEFGLHEALVTEALRGRIDRAREAGWFVELKPADDASIAALLARYIHDRARERIEGVPSSLADRRQLQVRLANRLLESLAAYEAGLDASDLRVDEEGRVLLEVDAPGSTRRRPRPGIPLTTSTLLVNAHRDLQIGAQLSLEISSADRIDLLCAFVRWAGVRLIRKELAEFLLAGKSMRVIASVYTGSTEKRALDDLVGLGAEVKISYDTSPTRLHAKSWLFGRDSGFDTAYVGSSNLTQHALLDGLEWNVRVTATDNAGIVDRIAKTFDQYWNDAEFEPYDPSVDAERLEAALGAQAQVHVPRPSSGTSVAPTPSPKPFQVPILDGLQAERHRGHFRNLVVAPTGTGKTWVSAFDYRRLRSAGYERLLFVAHRDEILEQSRNVFRAVLGEPTFGQRLAAGERPTDMRHVFASIQSMHRRIEDLDRSLFDVVVIDEFHHAEADTYRKLLEHVKPRILLGMTATPERADGKELLHWFDDRIAYEMRLWEALDRGLLSPFHYLGVGDETDLRAVRFERGRYAVDELEGIYTGNDVRAVRIIKAVRDWVLDPDAMRALGFCVSIEHARFMAKHFRAAGYPAVALDGGSKHADRRDAVRELREGKLRAIFTVDIFNEGVDIPEIDTLLLLRPTESATIFLQQLGRGLRWSPESGKTVLTVLDFIGQAHADYRFDVRYRALVGGTRAQITRAIEHGFPLMPPGCAIRLDEIAQKYVLDNLRIALSNRRRALVEDLKGLPADTNLSEFLEHSAFDLQDVYAHPSARCTFTAAKRAAGHIRSAPDPDEADFGKSIGRLLHVNDEERYQSWTAILAGSRPPEIAPISTREGRLQLMLFAGLGLRTQPVASMGSAYAALWSGDGRVRHELVELLSELRGRGFPSTEPLDPYGANPLHSHARYTRYEMLAAFGDVKNGRLREMREGVAWIDSAKTDVFLVTLDKSDEDFSPTTRYNDYPISPTRFHWESQSTTLATSPVGRRYVTHVESGSKVLLFVRERNDDDRGESNPFVCLGYANYLSHQSSRPMQIIWGLQRPMPPDIYTFSKAAAG